MRTAILLFCAAFASAASAGPVSGWAVVSANGDLVFGDHVSSASDAGPGTYIVDFTHSVKRCAFTANLGDQDGSLPGYVTVAAAHADPNGVFVVTFDADGQPASRGFHLNVRC